MPKKPRPSRPGLEISRAATGELTLFINGRHVPGNQTMVGLGRTEQPFEDGGPVHNPCAGLYAAARAALPAPQLGRQTFRAHDADVGALRALDLDHHLLFDLRSEAERLGTGERRSRREGGSKAAPFVSWRPGMGSQLSLFFR